MTQLLTRKWIDVCALDDLVPDRGVAALVDGRQIAVFRLRPDDALYAISNYDPFSDAFVMSRGIVGSHGDLPKVASPVYKHCFDLTTGRCLDDPEVELAVFEVRVENGRVQVGVS